jgi:vacuolar-type H+-ATPase subunit E/Vma4
MSDAETSASGRERLIESLWQDARREADQILLKARSEAKKLIEDVGLFREQEMAFASKKARDEALPHVSRILNHAQSRARQLNLEGRHIFLHSCFDEVLELVTRDSSNSEAVRASFPHLLRQALDVLDGLDDIEIILNPLDMEKARLLLHEAEFTFELVADEKILGGALLKAKNGSMIVDGTIEGRMSALKETPPVDVLKLISLNQDQ